MKGALQMRMGFSQLMLLAGLGMAFLFSGAEETGPSLLGLGSAHAAPLPTRKDEDAAKDAAEARAEADSWTKLEIPEQGFSLMFPLPPKVSAKPVAGQTPLIQHDYQVDPGDGTAYHAIVFEYPEGRAPKKNIAYFERLTRAYAAGSGAKLVSQGPATIGVIQGYEALAADRATGLNHVIDIIPHGDRVYMLVSAGPVGHAKSDEARRFRESFRILDGDEPGKAEEPVISEDADAPADGPVADSTEAQMPEGEAGVSSPAQSAAEDEALDGEAGAGGPIDSAEEDVAPDGEAGVGGPVDSAKAAPEGEAGTGSPADAAEQAAPDGEAGASAAAEPPAADAAEDSAAAEPPAAEAAEDSAAAEPPVTETPEENAAAAPPAAETPEDSAAAEPPVTEAPEENAAADQPSDGPQADAPAGDTAAAPPPAAEGGAADKPDEPEVTEQPVPNEAPKAEADQSAPGEEETTGATAPNAAPDPSPVPETNPPAQAEAPKAGEQSADEADAKAEETTKDRDRTAQDSAPKQRPSKPVKPSESILGPDEYEL